MSVTKQIEIKATPLEIFEGFVKPQELCNWWQCDAIVDAREGGLWVIGWGKDEQLGHQTVMAGVFQSYKPGEQISVFIDPVSITLDLAAVPGGSIVSITQSNYPDPSSEDTALETWVSSIFALKSYLESKKESLKSTNKPTVNVMASDISSYPGRDVNEPSGMYSLRSGEIAHAVETVQSSLDNQQDTGDYRVLDDGGFPINNPWATIRSWKKEQGFGYVEHPELGEVMFDYDGCDFEPTEGDKVLLLVLKKTWNGKPKCKRIACPAKGSNTKA
ncbi:MAG: SRPBCC domain-containing protein [Deltaproteobacteria bacterium]|nr:SRPBCC domain-containing protein [Deltaproteobacteria bacterium]